MDYINRKNQLDKQYNEATLMGLILEKEGLSKKRESYLKKLDKKYLIQILLSIEFGKTKGWEPVEVKSKKISKKEKELDEKRYLKKRRS